MFRKVFYTGSNEKAAAYSGIRTKRGGVPDHHALLDARAAWPASSTWRASARRQPTFGIGMELNVIAAAVIGGASLSGGSGTIFGAILGAVAAVGGVELARDLLNVSVYWQDIIRGSILLAAVTVDHYPQRTQGGAENAACHYTETERHAPHPPRAGDASHQENVRRPRSRPRWASRRQGEPDDPRGPRTRAWSRSAIRAPFGREASLAAR